MISYIYQYVLIPLYCFIPYAAVKLLLFIQSIFYFPFKRHRSPKSESFLCIEAGVKGWDSIEFNELFQSACEFLGERNVGRFVVGKDTGYLEQLNLLLKNEEISHYVYDPRTGNSEVFYWRAVWQSIIISLMLRRRGIVPIVLLTDLSVRAWRTQAAIVSASCGIVVCFMAPRIVQPIFPHTRLLGPSLMPFSIQTLNLLDQHALKRSENIPPKAFFTGSLYEPRTSILEKIRIGLELKGIIFEIKGRIMGSARSPIIDYWNCLTSSEIVVTTSVQATQDCTDWNHVPHLIYRYLEVLASGSLLVAQDVPGVRRYFTPGIHFVAFNSPQNAVNLISYYLFSSVERLAIANSGKRRADALINARCFWVQVDSFLGKNSLL